MPSSNLSTNTRIFLAVSIITLISSYTCTHVYSRNLNEEFLSLYREIVYLAKKGVHVSHMVSNLSVALEIAEQESVDNRSHVDELMRFIRDAIEELKKEVPRITLYRDMARLLTVISLASMPIIFYIFFPKLYLYTWFLTRRRWVVKSESTR